MFIGREKEIKILQEKMTNDQLEVGIVYGQRRIGKTSLINEAIKEYDHVYLLSRDTGVQDNLNDFSVTIAKYFNLPSFTRFHSLDELFDHLFKEIKEQTIVVIDELPLD